MSNGKIYENWLLNRKFNELSIDLEKNNWFMSLHFYKLEENVIYFQRGTSTNKINRVHLVK